MIPLPEFVDELRRRFDEELVKVEQALVSGAALDNESIEATALYYTGAVGRLNGIRFARNELDELVKAINQRGL
jgi:hypothetical protein